MHQMTFKDPDESGETPGFQSKSVTTDAAMINQYTNKDLDDANELKTGICQITTYNGWTA